MNNQIEFASIKVSAEALNSLSSLLYEISEKMILDIQPEEGSEGWKPDDNCGEYFDRMGTEILTKDQIGKLINIGLIL